MWKDWVFVVGQDAEGTFGLMPVGAADRREAARALSLFIAEGPSARIEWADQRFADEIRHEPGCVIEPVRDCFDYVYPADFLIHLPGQAYQAKRNHIHRFERMHPFHYAPLEAADIPVCLAVAEEAVHRDPSNSNLAGEFAAISEAFAHFSALELKGGTIRIDGKIEAFAVGGLLNPETALIYFEKANPGFPGLHAVINQRFLENAWPHVRWVNREDDAGHPGLRKSKLSYHPARLVPKYRITLPVAPASNYFD